MNHLEHSAPQPLLSAASRIAAAIGVASLVAAAWIGAQHASHEAVQTARVSFARGSQITLAPVIIVGHRASALAAVRPAGRGV
jgi:hypothetical protein